MNPGQGPWKGKSESKPGKPPSLQEAFEDAWNKAHAAGEPAGTYVMKEISIETTNPIHSYSVKIDHS